MESADLWCGGQIFLGNQDVEAGKSKAGIDKVKWSSP